MPQEHPAKTFKRQKAHHVKSMPLKNTPREPFYKRVAQFEKKSKQFEKERKEKAGQVDVADFFAEKPSFT